MTLEPIRKAMIDLTLESIEKEFQIWMEYAFRTDDGKPYQVPQAQMEVMRDAFFAGVHICNEQLRGGEPNWKIREALRKYIKSKLDQQASLEQAKTVEGSSNHEKEE